MNGVEAEDDELGRLQAENLALRSELEETNRGVLALYAELDQQAERLRHVSDLKSRFLSYMSHEFRTPLGSILSMTQMLERAMDGALSEDQHTQVRFISAAAIELREMVDDLLDLAKIEAGRISVAPAWFDVAGLFSALRGMFRPLVENSGGVYLRFDLPQAVPMLYTDDKKLTQILRNYIANALKFTPQGLVRVSAQMEDNALVRFSVHDTGIGIAKDVQSLLFEDFVQIDSPLQKKLRGTGLGLSLCKRFAELLGGRVGLVSEPGQGSEFYVVLPVKLAEEAGNAQ